MLRVPLEWASDVAIDPPPLIILAVDEALSRLHEEIPQEICAVEMRFFAGMKDDEIAEVLEVSPRTVRRWIAYAQARLYEIITDSRAKK